MRRLNLLLADDDEDDRLLFEEAFSEVAQNSTLTLTKDGKELLAYLSNPQSVMPDIIFLDLNMPIINGYKCLEEIRENNSLNNIFIVMNTTTASHKEISRVFEQGANLFLIKPNSYNDLKKSIEKIMELDFKKLMQSKHRESFVFNLDSFR